MASIFKGKTIASTYDQVVGTSRTDGFTTATTSSVAILQTDSGDGNTASSCLGVGTARVGIGTTAPDASLHIVSAGEGSVADGGTNVAQLLVESTGTTAGSLGPTIALLNSSNGVDNDYIGAISFLGDDDVGDATGDTSLSSTYGQIYCRILDATESSSPTVDGALFFAAPVNDTLTTHMYMAGGKVGIGTVAPAEMLEVANHAGQAKMAISSYADSATSQPELIFKKADLSAEYITDNDVLGQIKFQGYTDTFYTGAVIEAKSASEPGTSGTDMPADLNFYVADNGAVVDVTTAPEMTITCNGNVGIGVADPDAALEVVSDQGTGQFVAKFHHDGNTYNRHGIEVWAGAYDGDTTSGETIYLYALDGDGHEIGRLQHETGGEFGVHITSDARLKKDIVDTKIEGLNILNAVQVREFAWKKNGIKNKAGLIAQELKEVYPSAVSGDENQKVERKTSPRLGEFEPMGVSYASLIPPLVKAIQELSAKVTALENA